MNEGNDFRPLLNGAGEVVGIKTAQATSAEGFGSVTPINAAADLPPAAAVGNPTQNS